MAASGSSVPVDQSMAAAGGSSDPELLKFEETATFFLCRACNTHLSPIQQFVRRYLGNNKQYALFKNLVNVVLDPNYCISNTKTKVRSTYCIKCKADLGFKFLELHQETSDVKVGTYLLFMSKLLLWRDKEILDPEKEQLLHQKMTEEQRQQIEDFFNALEK